MAKQPVVKEEVYDTQISPLMAQIITICKRHNIAMLASFALPSEGDEDLNCLTAILSEEALADLPKTRKDDYLSALNILKHGFISYTVTRRT